MGFIISRLVGNLGASFPQDKNKLVFVHMWIWTKIMWCANWKLDLCAHTGIFVCVTPALTLEKLTVKVIDMRLFETLYSKPWVTSKFDLTIISQLSLAEKIHNY